MDERVLAAEGPHREAGRVERLPRRRPTPPARRGRRATPPPTPAPRSAAAGRQPQPRAPVGRNVVGVLVRDQHGVGAVEGGAHVAEHAGVDDQSAVAVVEADAGMRVLGQRVHLTAPQVPSLDDVHRGLLGAGRRIPRGRRPVAISSFSSSACAPSSGATSRPARGCSSAASMSSWRDVRLLLGQLLVERLALAAPRRGVDPPQAVRLAVRRGVAGV